MGKRARSQMSGGAPVASKDTTVAALKTVANNKQKGTKEAKPIGELSFDELLKSGFDHIPETEVRADVAKKGKAAKQPIKPTSTDDKADKRAAIPAKQSKPAPKADKAAAGAGKVAQGAGKKSVPGAVQNKINNNSANGKERRGQERSGEESSEEDLDESDVSHVSDDDADDSEHDDDEEIGEDDDEELGDDDDDDDVGNMSKHRKQLEQLQEADPEFYTFLKKNEKHLLAFGADEEDEDEDDEEDEEGGHLSDEELSEEEGNAGDGAAGAEEEEREGEERRRAHRRGEEEEDKESGPPELALPAFKAMEKGAFEDHAFKALARVLHAYRACCYMGTSVDVLNQLGLAEGLAGGRKSHMVGRTKRDKEARKDRSARRRTQEDVDEEQAKHRVPTLKYRIPSSTVFMTVVVKTLQQAAPAFAHHLGSRKGEKSEKAEAKPAPRADLTEYPGWLKLEPLVRSFLTATLELIAQAQEPSLHTFLLRSLRPYIPYLQAFNKLIKKYVKQLTVSFSAPQITRPKEDSEEGADVDAESRVRIAAFLRLRQMAVVLPYPTIDAVFKGTYLAFVRNAKFTNETSAPSIMLMCNCIAELYGVDEVTAYQHAFVYLRQLALHLRAALTTKSQETVQAVYSWQYVNCLRVWSAVLSRYATDPSRPLFQLVFPLVQIALGVAKLVTTARYYPLRLHVSAMLTELSWSTSVFIPVLPLLLDILRSPVLNQKPKEVATSTPPSLSLMIKVGKSSLESKAFQDAMVNKVLDLVLDAVKSQFYSISLPELVVPAISQLRHFAKATRVGVWRHRVKAIIDTFLAQSSKITMKRNALGAAPADRAAIASFMNTEAAALRAERAKAREQAAAQALKEAQEKAAVAARAVRFSEPQSEDDDEADEDDASSLGEDGEEEAVPAAKRPRKTSAKDAGKHGKVRVDDLAEGDDLVEDIDLDDLE